MNCTCRTNSLRIFVQTLTELRVTDPVISRSARLNHLGSPFVFHQTPAHRPIRFFSSALAASPPQQKWSNNVDGSSASKAEEKQSHILDTEADTVTDNSFPSMPSASVNDLTSAKLTGAILDYNPESIEMLVASLDRTLIVGPEATLKHNDLDSNAQSQPQLRSKPPIISSQLKRRKIIKDDVSPQSDAGEAQMTQREMWQIQKQALKEKFPEGWRPRKRLSPDALEGIRALHTQFPEQYTTEVLAKHFEVSPEAVRRILKSKWTASPDEEVRRQERWFNRGKNIWGQMAELGTKPPRRWRQEGIVRQPHWNQKKGPRTEYPYMPRREQPEEKAPAESAQRKLSSTLL
ncbi:hypothetical protein F5Y10DRAFT_231845 [Nemania abortiva]|nr:hypothetical protein F5Y10DRAFT_231845 [Nemania abortiva]